MAGIAITDIERVAGGDFRRYYSYCDVCGG